MPFDLGDTVRLEADCRDAGGTLVTAATATLTLALPDGTTATPTVPPPASTGRYAVDYVTAAAGRHAARWQWTGPAAAYTDAFDVRAAVPPMILSLADTKRHLQIPAAETTWDEELRDWIESVTEGCENLAGACVRRTVTERHDVPAGGTPTLALRRTPVLELTSLAPVLSGGTVYDVAQLDVDEPTGVVQRLDGGLLCGPLRAVYVAGRVVVPAAIRDAAKIILQHLWRTKYGAARSGRAIGGGEDYSVTEPVVGFGYAIPNRALQLLEPYRLPPGVA